MLAPGPKRSARSTRAPPSNIFGVVQLAAVRNATRFFTLQQFQPRWCAIWGAQLPARRPANNTVTSLQFKLQLRPIELFAMSCKCENGRCLKCNFREVQHTNRQMQMREQDETLEKTWNQYAPATHQRNQHDTQGPPTYNKQRPTKADTVTGQTETNQRRQTHQRKIVTRHQQRDDLQGQTKEGKQLHTATDTRRTHKQQTHIRRPNSGNNLEHVLKRKLIE